MPGRCHSGAGAAGVAAAAAAAGGSIWRKARRDAGAAEPPKPAAYPPNTAAEEYPDVWQNMAYIKSREEYDVMYQRSVKDPNGFWRDIAVKEYAWQTEPHQQHYTCNFDVRKASAAGSTQKNRNLHMGKVFSRWFRGGKTNMCYNCLDRHVEAGYGGERAFIFEGNSPGVQAEATYAEALAEVNRVANWLKAQGVRRGDYVALYMPMILELPYAMLACARIGAVHAVVFGGFSAEALAGRIEGCKAKVLITCSATMRGAKPVNLKAIADEGCEHAKAKGHEVPKVLVYHNPECGKREDVAMVPGRDEFWQDAVPHQSPQCAVEWVDAEDPLFLLYTSGSTGKPKGVVHATGGFMVFVGQTSKYVFAVHPGDVFWCTADCGWVTGHSYVTYGPLLQRATSLVFEGVPTYPTPSRCWEVKQFYTAPTLIRSLMRFGDDYVARCDRSSLRILGSVGEPINPEAWRWYHDVVGSGKCCVCDTWFQTETGGHMIVNLPSAWTEKPGSASLPFFGVQPCLCDDKGHELPGVAEGVLCIKTSWPGAIRGVFGDQQRFEETYFKPFPGHYFSGDGARRDEDGYYWITGRVDDVINVSGHRIGTAEVESALVAHKTVAEAAVVGYNHPIKGQGIWAYVTLKEGEEYSDGLKKELITTVRTEIGPFAAPDVIHWAPGLPKTRSGKIMRRILRKIAANKLDELGDTSTLADPAVVQGLDAGSGRNTMPALTCAVGRRPLLQPLRPARPVANAACRNAAGRIGTKRRYTLAPCSMLTFPSPGSSTEQQKQQQRQQQPGAAPVHAPAEQPAAPVSTPAHAPPASNQFAEAAVAAARELEAAAVAAAAASNSPMLVAFQVPACALAFGEHLRLVGSCAELGNWDPALAPALEWAEGDTWTVAVALPPGHHAFKLVLMRQDGSACWEEGSDRSLHVPSMPGAIAAEASAARGPLLRVTCAAFGNTAATTVKADRARMQAAAEAAKARISQLLQHKQQLAARLAALEAEVEQSEVRIAGMKEDTRRLVRAELQRLQQRGIVQAAVARLEGSAAQAQQAQQGQQAQQAGQRQKHPAAERRKQKRAAARAQLHSQYEQQQQQGGEAHAEPAEPAEVTPAELEHEVKMAAAEAAIRAALEPSAVPAEEQALLQASLLGEEPPAQHSPAQHLPAQPELTAAATFELAAAAAADEAPAEAVAASQLQPAEPAAAAAAAAAPAEQPPAASLPRAALMAAEGGLLRASTSRDGSIIYSFAASPFQLSAFHLAERHLVPQLPPAAVAGLWRALARMSLRSSFALSFAAGHLMQPARPAAELPKPTAEQQQERSIEAVEPVADRMSFRSHSLPGLALCLAAHSLFTAIHTLWAVARTAFPAAGRAAADAAFWLAASAATALPFMR
ncbi:acetyl-coenzyme A chloroplastic glyoxysomal isoform X1 isoform B [Chlorella sorokiniana]|uniref:acetate--CoA ligase n=1 Tax=Chlorella sorokiniana TaxID=3076 RepID=A0A2P6TGY5_CHLSO|nr:acetyl-coenzyme A chloroplastic glyoxysomal isoform X1 isoform B [Chlorella sorokiniana]|eukprot:PRW33545.1 acetyl-coenzyme A chloroplastic glyoxysomal isoform X1 isoform B [Chlorella sorokiniana]